jgi:hypothetical protein
VWTVPGEQIPEILQGPSFVGLRGRSAHVIPEAAVERLVVQVFMRGEGGDLYLTRCAAQPPG